METGVFRRLLMDFIAEMVLGYADSELIKKIEGQNPHIEDYQILRYRDDYRIFVKNSWYGEYILKCLTEVMIDLGLKLSPQKINSSSEVINSSIKEALLHETGSAVLASWFFGLRFFCNRIGLGFGQREQSVKHRTTHPCFGLLVR